MPPVTVRVPGLLARFTDGNREVELRAETAGAAVDALLETHPGLEPHVLDDGGALRDHVLLFVDGQRVDWAERDRVAVADGGTVTLMQAVSGGARRNSRGR